VKVVKN